MKKAFFAAAAATVMFSTAAFAAVTFDTTTGTGFVGKGDVQLAFNWNNQALQRNAGGVTFTYEAEEEFAAVCEWVTGEGTRGQKTHTRNKKIKVGVNSMISYESRKNSNGLNGPITGFILNGFGLGGSVGDEIPEVGDPCPGNEGNDGVWVSVDAVGGFTGGLYVNYGGTSVLLPETPVL